MSKKLIEESVKKRVKGEARKKIQRSAILNEDGAEVLDPQPLFHDLGFKQPESMNDKIRRITMQVQQETVAKLQAKNMTEEDIQRLFDEEDDFEIPDEYNDILTQYEARGLVSELQEQATLEVIPPAEPLQGEVLEPTPAPSEPEPSKEAPATS